MPTDPVSASCDPTEVLTALRAVDGAVTKRTDETAATTAQRTAEGARRRVARRTGETAATIHVEHARRGEGYVVIARGATLYLEFGTKYMRARAFLYPAADLERPGFERRIGNDVQDGITSTGLGP